MHNACYGSAQDTTKQMLHTVLLGTDDRDEGVILDRPSKFI